MRPSRISIDERRRGRVLIQQIGLPIAGIERMQAEALQENYKFLDTLLSEWVSGENRFEGVGEVLCGHLDEGLLVAVGGLSCDPYVDDPRVGRMRRVYVRQAWRNRGIGAALIETLLEFAGRHFSCVRLRAESAGAARLYERNGFVTITSPSATHMLRFENEERDASTGWNTAEAF